jgi:hypothetical protein
VNVCGTVTAYTASTANAPGSITIGGQTFPIAAGTSLSGAGILTGSANPNVCLQGSLNGSGQISNGTVTANAGATATVNVCGTVTAYTAATGTVPGSITVGGQTFPIAAGTVLNGGGAITVGSSLCLNATLNGSGQISNGTVAVTGTVTVNICGTVTAYTAATSTVPGSITIAGITFPIAAGTVFTGTVGPAVGTNLCLSTQVGGGQITGGSGGPGSGGTTISGPVTSFTPPSSSGGGSIVIGGTTFPVAAGSTLAVTGTAPLSATLVSHSSHGHFSELAE